MHCPVQAAEEFVTNQSKHMASNREKRLGGIRLPKPVLSIEEELGVGAASSEWTAAAPHAGAVTTTDRESGQAVETHDAEERLRQSPFRGALLSCLLQMAQCGWSVSEAEAMLLSRCLLPSCERTLVLAVGFPDGELLYAHIIICMSILLMITMMISGWSDISLVPPALHLAQPFSSSGESRWE
jgi:hypothetical protein